MPALPVARGRAAFIGKRIHHSEAIRRNPGRVGRLSSPDSGPDLACCGSPGWAKLARRSA